MLKTDFEWTEAQIARLTELHANTALSYSEIATALGNRGGRNSVIGKVHRLGLPPRQFNYIKPPRPKRHVRPRRVATRVPGHPRPPGPRPDHELDALRLLRRPKRLPPGPVTAPTCEPVALLDLEAHHCRWIEGATAGAATLFCGATKDGWPDGGTSYCAYHRAIASDRTSRNAPRVFRD